MISPPEPNKDLIEKNLANSFYSCYDAFCDLTNKKITIWEAIILAYNLGRMRNDKEGIPHLIMNLKFDKKEDFLNFVKKI